MINVIVHPVSLLKLRVLILFLRANVFQIGICEEIYVFSSAGEKKKTYFKKHMFHIINQLKLHFDK